MSAPAAFYDARPVASRYEARYAVLYEAALSLIPPGSRVVELGSGRGRFAALLLASGRSTTYLGIDFAGELVAEARRHVDEAVFRVDDLRTCTIPDADVYVALEVLEHLDDDLALLQRLPSHRTVVLSVPSFDSASHVRYFPEVGEAAKRYRAALDIDHETTIALPRGAFFHLLRGAVR